MGELAGEKDICQLEYFALEIRRQTIKELHSLGAGHVGGCMSIVELLAALYGGILRVDAQNPGWEERDRLVVSKGHAGPAVYAALALRGFFPLEKLNTLNRPGTDLPSHMDAQKTPGVDMTTGSLGQGVSAGVGIALARRMDRKDGRVYIIAGDGECDEGQVWEAILFAAAQKLDNLILLIDRNHYQLDGGTDDILKLGSLEEKLGAFGWNTLSVEDGHDVGQIYRTLLEAHSLQEGMPTAVVLNTVKGKGYPAAGRGPNHHMIMSDEDFEEAMQKLGEEEKRLREKIAREGRGDGCMKSKNVFR